MKRLTLLLPCLLLAACGGGGDKTKTVTVKSDASPTASATAAADASATAAAPQPDAKAIAAETGTIDGKEVRLEVVQLKRSGNTVTLNLRLTAPGADLHAQVADTFDDGDYQKVEGGDSIAGGSTMDGISLIDTTNDKRHLVGRDETGQCVCGVDLGGKFVEADSPLLLSATYGAPPPDVKAMSIVIPAFGTLADVPLG